MWYYITSQSVLIDYYRYVLELVKMKEEGGLASLIVLDQSVEDQLVPVNQTERFIKRLRQVEGLRVVRGTRCTGRHAAPWEEGNMLWAAIEDVLANL